MKLTLDFENKIVSADGNCNLKEIVDTLKNLVDDWKVWDIQFMTYNYNWPIYYDYQEPYKITYGSDTVLHMNL